MRSGEIGVTTMRNDPRPARAAGLVFAYSNWDAILVLITLAQFGAIIWGAANVDRLGAAGLAVYALAQIVLATTQYDVVTHNFIHNRFFRSRTLNSIYALMCSAVGMSVFTEQMLEHLNHHKHVNDPVDPATGKTRDPSSTFRFGKDGEHEAMWRYALLLPLRQALESPDYCGRRSRVRRQIRIEAAFTLAFWIAIGLIDWRFLLLSVAIVYLAQVLTAAQNYLEHYGAVPHHRMADSVSCYGRLYNVYGSTTAITRSITSGRACIGRG